MNQKPTLEQIINLYTENSKKKDHFKKNLTARQIRFNKRRAEKMPYLRTEDQNAKVLFIYSMLLKQTQTTTQFLNPFKNKTNEQQRLKLLELANTLVDNLEKDLSKEILDGENQGLDETYWDASEIFFDLALHSFDNYVFLKMVTEVLNIRPEFIPSIISHIETLEKEKNGEHQESTSAISEPEN
jgi:hypothetical protein